MNVRTQLVRSTSLAYSLTISRTRHRRRRSGYITSLTIHHGRGLPSTDLAHHPLTLSLAVMYYVLRPHHDHSYYCMQVAQTPPCAARHFSSPPQAITTSSLPVSSPLPPPPPPPSPLATNCTNVTYTTYTTYATTVTTLGPPPPLPLSFIVTITAKLNPPTCSMDPNGEPVIRR